MISTDVVGSRTQGGFEMDWGDLFQGISWIFVALVGAIVLFALADDDPRPD